MTPPRTAAQVGTPGQADGVVTGQTALDELVGLLDLEQLELNLFRGISPPHSPTRVFGGQVAGQALVAAGRTVEPERAVHSLHSYFLRPGDPRVPIVFDVERVRDGRSFTTRRVRAVQHGEVIFTLGASFQLPQPGSSTPSPRRPGSRPPRTCPTWGSGCAASGPSSPACRGRWTCASSRHRCGRRGAGRRRTSPSGCGCGPTGRCRTTRCCTSACSPTPATSHCSRRCSPRTRALSQVALASLDHAMWFHHPFRADEWLLYESARRAPRGHAGSRRAGSSRATAGWW